MIAQPDGMMNLSRFLKQPVTTLLGSEPFSRWTFTRHSPEDELDTDIRYTCDDHHVELLCDVDERVTTIFLHAGADETLAGLPFSLQRREVLDRLGTPSASRDAFETTFLGPQGGWDRFSRGEMVIHVQYRADVDAIALITLMSADVAP